MGAGCSGSARKECERAADLRGDRDAEALQIIDEVLADHPDYRGAWVTKAALLRNLDRTEEALQIGEDLVARYPDYFGSYDARGGAYDLVGEDAKANADFDKSSDLGGELGATTVGRVTTVDTTWYFCKHGAPD